MLGDSIGAIATPLGEGGIGIVRVTGAMAIEGLSRIFQPARPKDLKKVPSHTVHLGYIIDPETGEKVDQVLVLIMRGPRSFTGEDVVEIHCHGGIVSLKKILELVLQGGVRLAEPGEFAKRAFLNGKLDLAQAESIIDIIRAKTEDGLKMAVGQLEGELSGLVREAREKLLSLLALIEANLDFPEEDIEPAAAEELKEGVNSLLFQVKELLRNADAGKIMREGIKTVIVGKPNVGKSSLMNALLKEARAIVTDIPGTTRDIIEELVNVGGVPVRLVDTAGIRETQDKVERIGVERTIQSLEKADLVLLVLDRSESLTAEDREVIDALGQKKALIILNKCDIPEGMEEGEVAALVGERPVLPVSAKEEIGLEQIGQAIRSLVMGGEVGVDQRPLVSNVRHKEALMRVQARLQEAAAGLAAGMSLDCITIDLRGAWEALGEITGETVGEEILDEIFSRFCIGK